MDPSTEGRKTDDRKSDLGIQYRRRSPISTTAAIAFAAFVLTWMLAAYTIHLGYEYGQASMIKYGHGGHQTIETQKTVLKIPIQEVQVQAIPLSVPIQKVKIAESDLEVLSQTVVLKQEDLIMPVTRMALGEPVNYTVERTKKKPEPKKAKVADPDNLPPPRDVKVGK